MSSIEDIVIKIQHGEDLKNELFSRIYKLLYHLCKHYADYARELGYSMDDLLSMSWLGAENAIKAYKSGSGARFNTFLTLHVKTAVLRTLNADKAGKDSLTALPLDEPIPGTDDLTYAETVEDESTTADFEDAENRIYYRALYDELEKLPTEQRCAVKRLFFQNMTLRQAAAAEGVSCDIMRARKNRGMTKLRKSQNLRECYYNDFAYHHIGVSTFNTTWTSSTEWAALKVMRNTGADTDGV